MEYTLQDYCNRIREDVKDYDYILIGLGDEALNNNDGNLIDMLNKFRSEERRVGKECRL